MMKATVERVVQTHCPESLVQEEWDLAAVATYINGQLLSENGISEKELKGKEQEELIELITEKSSLHTMRKKQKSLQNKCASLKK